jgi:NADH:ubiquinone oxidoreductase subunit 4 (subunit M)
VIFLSKLTKGIYMQLKLLKALLWMVVIVSLAVGILIGFIGEFSLKLTLESNTETLLYFVQFIMVAILAYMITDHAIKQYKAKKQIGPGSGG